MLSDRSVYYYHLLSVALQVRIIKYQQVTRVRWLSAVQYRPLSVITAMSAGGCLVEVPRSFRTSTLILRRLIIVLTQSHNM